MILLVLVGAMDEGSKTGKHLMGHLIPSSMVIIKTRTLWRMTNMGGRVKGTRCSTDCKGRVDSSLTGRGRSWHKGEVNCNGTGSDAIGEDGSGTGDAADDGT